jgi:hypothetical protein
MSRSADELNEPDSGLSRRMARASFFSATWYALTKSAAVRVQEVLVAGMVTRRRDG